MSSAKTNLYISMNIRQSDGTKVCCWSGTLEQSIEKMKETARIYGSAPLHLEEL